MFRNRQTLWLTISAAFNVAFLAALIYMTQIQPDAGRGRRRHRGYPKEWSQAEQAQIDSLSKNFWANMHRMRDSSAVYEKKLATQMKVEIPDTAFINEQLKHIALWNTAMRKMAFHQIIRERNVLEPGNREAYIEMWTNRWTRSRGPGKTEKKSETPKEP